MVDGVESCKSNDLAIASDAGKRASPLFLGFLYGCCLVVTVTYVQLFALYSYFRELFGRGFITWAPIAVTLVVLPLLVAVFYFRKKKSSGTVQWSLVVAGMVLAVIALFIPEPNLGAKRIHVAEYILLSLLVRYTLSHRHSGLYLFLLSLFFTIFCGIHDEFLQGLHQQRTYGLRDIAVNSVSAVAGCCIWQGLGLFTREKAGVGIGVRGQLWPLLYLFWLGFSVFLVSVPMPSYRYSALPLWIFLPLAASMVYCVCFLPRFWQEHQHGLYAVSCAAFLLFLYPVMTNVFQIPFY